ncbi:MAG TPA: choice-of-anchor tandem repeat GloVer-containing protein [Candidatus Cybelea sp.]
MRLSLVTVLGASLTAALLAACGGATSNPPLSNSMQNSGSSFLSQLTAASDYKVLYSFGGHRDDGVTPQAKLLYVNGTLYGTTPYGGRRNGGIVFSITTSGAEKVLHQFGKGNDGEQPQARMTNVNGKLWGTTYSKGASGKGTVFTMTTSGAEHVLYSFGSTSTDGAYPSASLIGVAGTFYGTTDYGGATSDGDGTVFSITTSGAEKVLHSFGNGTDGISPTAGLIDVNGTLYGTTFVGGRTIGGSYYGTVFSITTSGSEKVLHSFGKSRDGAEPAGGLLNVNGVLYGTTEYGGAHGHANSSTGGTVFSITTSGQEKVLHSFGKGLDGAVPAAGLIDVNGTICGTTFYGGRQRRGTVFSITTGGTEKVLHNFGKGNDGANPDAALTNVNGTLYGTTSAGGAHGDGTVFSLKP